MKRFIYFILTATLILCLLCGCGSSENNISDERIILSAWKNGLENELIAARFTDNTNKSESTAEGKDIRLSYLNYDFNGDGTADCIVTASSALYSKESGDFCCILISDKDGFSEIAMPYLPVKTPQKDELFGFSYFEVSENETNGMPDLILYADSIINLEYDGTQYRIADGKNK